MPCMQLERQLVAVNALASQTTAGSEQVVNCWKDISRLTLISSKGDKTKDRTTPATPAATGTANDRLGRLPGVCNSHTSQSVNP